jgi:hypothetical protein
MEHFFPNPLLFSRLPHYLLASNNGTTTRAEHVALLFASSAGGYMAA